MQEHRELRSIPRTQKSNTREIGFVKHHSFKFWFVLETQQNIMYKSYIHIYIYIYVFGL